jgi:hypothetical protein
MSARSRSRSAVDFNRVANGLQKPGIDPRTWLAFARIDEDPDATVWDDELGWLCDVTFVGGGLDGDGPNLARWGGRGVYRPPVQGALCLVAVVGGDPNDDLVILGMLDDADSAAPASVNGDAIDEAMASRTHIVARPDEDADVEMTRVRVNAELVLGAADADQSYVRGDDYAGEEAKFLDALDTFLSSAPPPGPFGQVSSATFIAAAAPLKLAIQQFKLAKNTYLSQRIKGT